MKQILLDCPLPLVYYFPFLPSFHLLPNIWRTVGDYSMNGVCRCLYSLTNLGTCEPISANFCRGMKKITNWVLEWDKSTFTSSLTTKEIQCDLAQCKTPENPSWRGPLEMLQSWRKLELECAICCERKPAETKSYQFSHPSHPFLFLCPQRGLTGFRALPMRALWRKKSLRPRGKFSLWNFQWLSWSRLT